MRLGEIRPGFCRYRPVRGVLSHQNTLDAALPKNNPCHTVSSMLTNSPRK
jgi:hypothetical protein